jgi:hypothetical protein
MNIQLQRDIFSIKPGPLGLTWAHTLGTHTIASVEYIVTRYEEHGRDMDKERSDEYIHDRHNKYEYMYEEHSDEYMDDRQYEYMYEEHSDEYMDDRQYEEHSDEYIVYMSRANAIRPNKKYAAVARKGHIFLSRMVFSLDIFYTKRPSFIDTNGVLHLYFYCKTTTNLKVW